MASPETLTVTVDTQIRSESATTNYDGTTTFAIGEWNSVVGRVDRLLLKFNGLSDGTIPANAIVDSAVLSIYCMADVSTNARTFRVFRPKRAWVTTEATWSIWKALSNWSTAGGFHVDDCEQTDIGYRDMTDAETIDEYKNFPLTASAVQEYISGVWADNGFLLKADGEANDAYRFNALELGSNPPILVVNYHVSGYPKIIWFL